MNSSTTPFVGQRVRVDISHLSTPVVLGGHVVDGLVTAVTGASNLVAVKIETPLPSGNTVLVPRD